MTFLLSAQNVHNGKDDNPNPVHKMPVPGQEDNAPSLRLYREAREIYDQTHTEEEESDNDVAGVKADQ
jgi:hypothetical protein